MHDQIYAQQIIEQAEATNQRIKAVSLEIGDIAPIGAEVLEKAIRNLRPGWRVKIYKIPAKIKCKKCGFEGKPNIVERLHESVIFECPVCADFPEIIEGDKIILKSVDIED